MWGWGHGWGMALWWIVVPVLLVAGVWWLAGSRRTGRQEDAEDLLRRRFAAGEISEAEYRERLAALRGGSTGKGGPQ